VPSLYIDGEWVASAKGECSPVVNPSDASVVTEVDVATDEQVHAAIAAARRAFDETDWSRRPTGERAALLDRVAGLIDRDLEELARLETVNTGKAMRESRWDMSDVARVFRYYADLADKDAGRLVDTGNPDALGDYLKFNGEIPITIVYDGAGRELWRHQGRIDRNQTIARLRELLRRKR